ncbi:MAG: EamA family transporter [Pseudomonas marincola]
MFDFNIVLILLIAALMHAIWNAVVKFNGEKIYILSMIDGMAMLIGLLFIPFVAIPEIGTWFYIATSVILNIFYRIFLIKAYELGEFSSVYPLVRGLPPLAVTIMAMFFLDENIAVTNLSGIALISAGIITLMLGRFDYQKRTILYSVTSGLFIAVYTVIDGAGIRLSNNVFSYIVWFTVLENLPFPLYTTLCHHQKFKIFLRTSFKKGFLGGLAAAAGYGIVLWAMTQTNLGSVSALREASILFATIIGLLVFKESFGLKKIMASSLIVTGIFLIQFSI